LISLKVSLPMTGIRMVWEHTLVNAQRFIARVLSKLFSMLFSISERSNYWKLWIITALLAPKKKVSVVRLATMEMKIA